MNVITIEGKLGSGAPEIAKDIAKKLSFDYIDRIIMAEIAKKVNTPLDDVMEKEENVHSGLNKFVRAIQRIIKNSASAGMAGDPLRHRRGLPACARERRKHLHEGAGGGEANTRRGRKVEGRAG